MTETNAKYKKERQWHGFSLHGNIVTALYQNVIIHHLVDVEMLHWWPRSFVKPFPKQINARNNQSPGEGVAGRRNRRSNQNSFYPESSE